MSAVPGEGVVSFEVSLPAGGVLHLQTSDEVALWNESKERLEEEYTLSKQNDKVTLGMLLQQQVIVYRCQMGVNGMEPETDSNGVPTGAYRRVEVDPGEMSAFQATMTKASVECRELEKMLGIDKKTREAGGVHTVDSYIRTLKRAGHQRGVHISQRVIQYEKVINELRVRLRLLYTADEEDRKYHNITPKTVLDWLREECESLAEVDRRFNREKGKVFIGQL